MRGLAPLCALAGRQAQVVGGADRRKKELRLFEARHRRLGLHVNGALVHSECAVRIARLLERPAEQVEEHRIVAVDEERLCVRFARTQLVALAQVHLAQAGERIPVPPIAAPRTEKEAHGARWLLELERLVPRERVGIRTLGRHERRLPKALVGCIVLVLKRPGVARGDVRNGRTRIHREQVLRQSRQGHLAVQLEQHQRVNVHVHTEVRLHGPCTSEMHLGVGILGHVVQRAPHEAMHARYAVRTAPHARHRPTQQLQRPLSLVAPHTSIRLGQITCHVQERGTRGGPRCASRHGRLAHGAPPCVVRVGARRQRAWCLARHARPKRRGAGRHLTHRARGRLALGQFPRLRGRRGESHVTEHRPCAPVVRIKIPRGLTVLGRVRVLGLLHRHTRELRIHLAHVHVVRRHERCARTRTWCRLALRTPLLHRVGQRVVGLLVAPQHHARGRVHAR